MLTTRRQHRTTRQQIVAFFSKAALHVLRIVPLVRREARQDRLPPVLLEGREIDAHDSVRIYPVQVLEDVSESLSHGQAPLRSITGTDRLAMRNIT